MGVRAKKKPAKAGDRHSATPLLGKKWVSWIHQAEAYSERGLVNARLYERLLRDVEWMEEYERKPLYRHIKRGFDLVFSALLLILLSPVFLLCALAVRITSPGPILFRQLRCGLGAKPFFCYKFRTYLDSDQPITAGAPMVKSGKASRTPIGGELRNWRLDELPQIWNVLKGDMSLVGPRPLSLEDCVTIPEHFSKRFAVMPGITGEWQANRPNTIPSRSKLRLDCLYVNRRGFRHDFYLLWRTISVVAKGERGAERSYTKKHHRPPSNPSDRKPAKRRRHSGLN